MSKSYAGREMQNDGELWTTTPLTKWPPWKHVSKNPVSTSAKVAASTQPPAGALTTFSRHRSPSAHRYWSATVRRLPPVNVVMYPALPLQKLGSHGARNSRCAASVDACTLEANGSLT